MKLKKTKWETKWEQIIKMGQKWEQNENRQGTRTPKWHKNGEQNGIKMGTRTPKRNKNGNKVE